MFLIATFFICSSLLCLEVAKYIPYEDGKVVDIIQNNIPYLDQKYTSDFFIISEVVVFLLTSSMTDISEGMLIAGIAQFMRAITICTTVLPPLRHNGNKIRMFGVLGHGTEYIFSGHSVYSCISTIYLFKNKIVSYEYLVIYNIIIHFLIIVTHNHYTIDVVLAWLIVPLIYGNLHFCQKVTECKEVIEPYLTL